MHRYGHGYGHGWLRAHGHVCPGVCASVGWGMGPGMVGIWWVWVWAWFNRLDRRTSDASVTSSETAASCCIAPSSIMPVSAMSASSDCGNLLASVWRLEESKPRDCCTTWQGCAQTTRPSQLERARRLPFKHYPGGRPKGGSIVLAKWNPQGVQVQGVGHAARSKASLPDGAPAWR